MKRLTNLIRSPRVTALALGGAVAALPALAAAQEAEGGGIAALGVSLPGLIAQLVNFTILLVLLRLFLFGPIMRMVDERKRRIEEGLRASEQAANAAEQSQEESRRVLDEARAEGRELVARTQETAARLRGELEAQARRDAEQIVNRTRAEMELESQRAIQALRGEFADLAIRAAERVVGQSLDRAAHQRLIDEVLVDSSFNAVQRDGNN
ncbi:MAG: F0F1 ATP synthase subunit B [Dehalococcoidia bacterium]